MLRHPRRRWDDDTTEAIDRVSRTPLDDHSTGPGTSPRSRTGQPWRLRLQRWLAAITRPAVAAGMVVFGTATMFVAWTGTAGRTEVSEQLTWLLGAGITGLAFILLGGLWIADHEVHRATSRLDRFERDVTRLHHAIVGPERSPAPVSGTVAPYPATTPDVVFAVPHGETYHRANCLVIREKANFERYDHGAVPEPLRPCVVCRPDESAA